MKKFKARAEVINIYGNDKNTIETTYTAADLATAKKGFIAYLQSNKNLVSFKNVKIIQ